MKKNKYAHNGMLLDDLINHLKSIKEQFGGNIPVVGYDHEWDYYTNFYRGGVEIVELNPEDIRREPDEGKIEKFLLIYI